MLINLKLKPDFLSLLPITVTPSEKRTPASVSSYQSSKFIKPVAKKQHLQDDKYKNRKSVKVHAKKINELSHIGLGDISQVISIINRNKSHNLDFLYLI